MRSWMMLTLVAALIGCEWKKDEPEEIANDAQGIWLDVTGSGFVALVLPNDEFWFFRENVADDLDGVVHGLASGARGVFGSTETHFYDGSRVSATVLGTFQARTNLSGTIEAGDEDMSFSMGYYAAYEDPAQLAALATGYQGEWQGEALVQGVGSRNFYLQVDANGGVNGVVGSGSERCTLSGIATPSEENGTFDLSVDIASSGGAICPNDGETLSGIAFAIDHDAGQDGVYGAIHAENGHVAYAIRAPQRVLF